MQVLWIYGTSCVGKSATAWELYAHAELGPASRIGYVDIDQLGMCYPASDDDPDREHLKAGALHALMGSLAHIPLDLLIISGVMDPAYLELYASADLGVDFIFIRLRLEEGELARRCMARWQSPVVVQDILEDARMLEASGLPHPTVDATGLTVEQVAQAVQELSALWPLATGHSTGLTPAQPLCPAGEVLVVSGPTPVGKSTVGFQTAGYLVQSGVKAGYLDLAQLGFVRPALPAAVAAQQRALNLLGVWRVFHDAGARRLVMSGPFASPRELDACLEVLAGCTITVCRLEADASALRKRCLARSLPGGPELAGDTLLGSGPDDHESLLRTAVDESDLWSEWNSGTVIDTTLQDPGETIGMVLRAANWLPAS